MQNQTVFGKHLRKYRKFLRSNRISITFFVCVGKLNLIYQTGNLPDTVEKKSRCSKKEFEETI